MASQAGDITRLLRQADRGDREAANQLFVLVENDLKVIARKRKRAAPGSGGVATTLLVDEVFCRLVGQDKATWDAGDRRKFFGYASNQIHDLLIKTARAERAAKRGGGYERVELDNQPLSEPASGLELLLDLKAALDRFEQVSPQDALLFRLRYFLDCTFEEVAEVVGVSLTESKRAYQRAKLWLQRELKEYNLDS